MDLEEAVAVLQNTYASLESIARFLPVNAEEVHAALADVDSDTSEAIALQALAKYNPIKIKQDVADSEYE